MYYRYVIIYNISFFSTIYMRDVIIYNSLKLADLEVVGVVEILMNQTT
ncbi:hypothetical protein ACVW0P_004206 [Mucilaginibacter sp. UYNi724]